MRFGFQLCEEFKPSLLPENAIAEIKMDGIMCISENGKLYNRRKRIIGYQFPELKLPQNAVLVGEIVVYNEANVSDFNLILRRNTDNKAEIRLRSKIYPAHFVAFDILEFEGESIASKPLKERLELLKSLNLDSLDGHNIEHPQTWDKVDIDSIDAILELVREYGQEGIIIKDLDKPYVASRNNNWLKLKAYLHQVFEIKDVEHTQNEGFVILIEPKENLRQRVVCNGHKDQEKIARGYKYALVRYLQQEDSGLLRQPSLKKVYEKKESAKFE